MPQKILFIHHSTGANLLHQGEVRKILQKINPEMELWDHSYNLYKHMSSFFAKFTFHTGLSSNKGRCTGTDYNIVLSNNSPKEYADILSREPHDKTLRSILKYDIIAFKNCYPTTKITSKKQLEEYKQYYEVIRNNIAKYKDKKFILVTPPPLRKELTKPIYAHNAQELVGWLNSDGYKKQVSNLFIFDLFNLLADPSGYLKTNYNRLIPLDSHPNYEANKTISPIFAKYLSVVNQA